MAPNEPQGPPDPAGSPEDTGIPATREEAVRLALARGVPLSRIEAWLDWLDLTGQAWDPAMVDFWQAAPGEASQGGANEEKS